MKKACYIVALVLALIWFLAFFALGAGTVVHTLLMIGLVFYLQGIITCSDLKTSKAD
ncbi:MAG TPA: hypothetical protein VFZ42_12870 [Chitinophagaceae bacterium]